MFFQWFATTSMWILVVRVIANCQVILYDRFNMWYTFEAHTIIHHCGNLLWRCIIDRWCCQFNQRGQVLECLWGLFSDYVFFCHTHTHTLEKWLLSFPLIFNWCSFRTYFPLISHWFSWFPWTPPNIPNKPQTVREDCLYKIHDVVPRGAQVFYHPLEDHPS